MLTPAPNEKAGQKTDSFIGVPDRIRTYDLRLRKPTLYPAELRVLIEVRYFGRSFTDKKFDWQT